MKYTAFAALFLALFLGCGAAQGAQAKDGKVPTSIRADGMEYNAGAQTVIFKGKVHVSRTDLELWADAITVYMKKSAEKAQHASAAGDMAAGDIDRIVATGDVRMKSDNKTGQCQKATYYAKTGKFVMEGSPVLREGENSIRGATIVHYMTENRTEVQQGVQAEFLAPDRTDKLTPGKNGKGKSFDRTNSTDRTGSKEKAEE